MKHNQTQSQSWWQRLLHRHQDDRQAQQVNSDHDAHQSPTQSVNANQEVTSDATTAHENGTTMSRVARKQAHQTEFQNAKTIHPDMRRRLNWAIGIVALLIVVVYLVLFFV